MEKTQIESEAMSPDAIAKLSEISAVIYLKKVGSDSMLVRLALTKSLKCSSGEARLYQSQVPCEIAAVNSDNEAVSITSELRHAHCDTEIKYRNALGEEYKTRAEALARLATETEKRRVADGILFNQQGERLIEQGDAEKAERKRREEAERRAKQENDVLAMIKSRILGNLNFVIPEKRQRITYEFLEKCSKEKGNDVEISLRSFVKLALGLKCSSLDFDKHPEEATKLLKEMSVNLKAQAVDYNALESRRKLKEEIVKLLQSGQTSLNSVDVSQVTDMSLLFFEISQEVAVGKIDVSRWDVSHVTDMGWMFAGCESFKGNLSRWDVSGVTAMSCMFAGCGSFNGNLSGWDVSGIENMNKLVRQYIPKDADFSRITDKFIMNVQKKLNLRPREKLNFSTPKHEFFKLFT